MIRCLLTVTILFFVQEISAQKFFTSGSRKNNRPRDCGLLIVDLNNGTLNGLNPVASFEEIKMKLPCFTHADEESPGMNCGGGVFFKNKFVDFYTNLDYISIKAKFTGNISFNKTNVSLLGATASQVFSILGRQPGFFRSSTKAGHKSAVYEMSYGLLVINYLFDHVIEIDILNQKKADLKLCD